MVFTVKDNAILPLRGQFERAVSQVPRAHAVAQREGMAHLHRAVVSAAEEAGLPTGPISVNEHFVGIDHSLEGDALADHEFGHDDVAPNPVLRTAHSAALPHARAHYTRTLIREIGF